MQSELPELPELPKDAIDLLSGADGRYSGSGSRVVAGCPPVRISCRFRPGDRVRVLS
jgi:hypothetical protein